MEPDIGGFRLEIADRIQKCKGVTLFIRNTIAFTIIDNESHESGTCELVSCRLKCKGQELLIDLVYRSSNYEVNEVLVDSINTWSQRGRRLILKDFDAPTVDWKNLRMIY